MSSSLIQTVTDFFKKTDKRILAGGSLALALVVGGGAYYFITRSSVDEIPVVTEDCVPKTTVAVTDDDYIIGDKNAPVTLVEYLSQTCSHCAEFSRNEVPKLEEIYVKTGKLRIVFRELHRNNVDLAASVLGRCLGREGFLPFTDMLLENQQTWMMREDNNIIEGLREMARRAGMASAEFDTCMKKQDLAKELFQKSSQGAKDYCITGTPTLLLNGKKLEGMNTAFDKLDAAIREELKKAGVEAPPPASEAAAEPADGATAADAPVESPVAPAAGAPPSQ